MTERLEMTCTMNHGIRLDHDGPRERKKVESRKQRTRGCTVDQHVVNIRHARRINFTKEEHHARGTKQMTAHREDGQASL